MNLMAYTTAATTTDVSRTASSLFVGGFVGFFLLMWLVGIALFIFWIFMIIDIARREFPNPNDKIIWLIVVLLFHFVGGLIYFFTAHNSGHIPGNDNGSNKTPAPTGASEPTPEPAVKKARRKANG